MKTPHSFILFKKAISTLLHSWGGDTPAEAVWAANEFINYFNVINNTNLPMLEEEGDASIEAFNEALDHLIIHSFIH